jgi:hypothetical protein
MGTGVFIGDGEEVEGSADTADGFQWSFGGGCEPGPETSIMIERTTPIRSGESS